MQSRTSAKLGLIYFGTTAHAIQEAIDNESWNPFEPSQNTQESLDFIETTTTRVGKSTNKSFDLTLKVNTERKKIYSKIHKNITCANQSAITKKASLLLQALQLNTCQLITS